jgi:phosphatidylinositol glycan class W
MDNVFTFVKMSGKQEKIAHVSGHLGTTKAEINIILSVVVFGYWLNQLLGQRVRIKSMWGRYTQEFITLVCPFMISNTYAEYSVYILSLLIGLILFVSLFPPQTDLKARIERHEPFIVAYRGILQLITMFAILAVDFHVFPRRFAKTETYGTSLMDIGVGCFVFSSGLVAGPRIQLKSSGTFWKTVKLVVPSLILGFGRAFVTKAIEYQEHISEYGVHWNFFITLGTLPILISLQNVFLPRVPLAMIGSVAISIYQFALHSGLEDFAMNAPRTNLFTMNKEGILSMAGIFC